MIPGLIFVFSIPCIPTPTVIRWNVSSKGSFKAHDLGSERAARTEFNAAIM
jgi:hypothetical protein